eukprot:scaffold6882_cov117-Isochrysis_galbana.AAC.6
MTKRIAGCKRGSEVGREVRQLDGVGADGDGRPGGWAYVYVAEVGNVYNNPLHPSQTTDGPTDLPGAPERDSREQTAAMML